MKINKTWMCMLVMAGGLLVAAGSAKAASADKQLQKGIEAYQQNDHDEALDCFIDVLMNGDNEQVAQANKYIDAIHNKIGGIKQPVEVDVSFPDQPVQTVLNNTDAWAKQNAQNVQALSNQVNQTAQDTVNSLNAAPLSLTEQIEQRQLANYAQQGIQPVNAAQDAVLNEAAAARQNLNTAANQYGQQINQYGQQASQYGQQAVNQVNQYGQQVAQAGQQIGQQVNQYGQQAVGQVQAPVQAYMDDMNQLANDYELEYQAYQAAVSAYPDPLQQTGAAAVAQPVNGTPAVSGVAVPAAAGARDAYISPNLSPAAYAEQSKGGFTTAPDYNMPASYTFPSQTQQTPAPVNAVPAPKESAFTDLTSSAAVEARNLYTAQKLQSMRDNAIAALTAEKGVHLYLRPDGRPDAIDIDDGVLFQGSSFRTEAFGTLNNIYDLLALTQGTRYIILPAGSYTDDVTLPGIRQAMALKSYLTKRGISQGKLYYNMGLVDDEVPTQFSNLKGLSIVFDYDANLPTRMLENAENETAPLLSMAIVPQCHAIDRALGEAYAIDFSVLDTVNPINNWVLQVVQHGRNGNYYIVRQLEGFGPVYHQILWNGRKGIIGPELPCGKYTLVLTGVDSVGNKNVLRRRVVVKCAGAAVMGSCQTGNCAKKDKSATKASSSNYKAARLWKKPGRVMYCSQGCMGTAAAVQEEETVQQQNYTETENVETASSSSGTYTKTETVRNIVVDDNSSQPDAVYSSVDSGYAPMPSNAGGYAPAGGSSEVASYEEEYTSY